MSLCFECDGPASHDHHVLPRIMGGTRTVPLCEICHGKIHEQSMRNAALTKLAMEKKRASGEKTGGDVPYGYRVALDGKTLIVDPVEQTLLKLVRREHTRGLPVRSIADMLDDLGFRTRKGTRFSPTQVQRFIERIRGVKGAAQKTSCVALT